MIEFTHLWDWKKDNISFALLEFTYNKSAEHTHFSITFFNFVISIFNGRMI